jgi:hypothetical protein
MLARLGLVTMYLSEPLDTSYYQEARMEGKMRC